MVLKGHREQDSSNDIRKNSDTQRTMQRGNFKCVCNIWRCINESFRIKMLKTPRRYHGQFKMT